MVRKIICLLLFSLSCGPVNPTENSKRVTLEKKEWTLLVYIEASEGLNQYAIKNITDMIRAGVPTHVNICVQWHAQGRTAWRLRCVGNQMISEKVVGLTPDVSANLYSALNWAYSSSPAGHYGMVVWSHGHGILEPVWNEKKNEWKFLVCNDACTQNTCAGRTNKLTHRGMLGCSLQGEDQLDSREPQNAFLTNQGLSSVLQQTQTRLLDGKKLDLLIIDACCMAMVEVLAGISKHVSFCAASQDCQLGDGCDYHGLMQILQERSLRPRTVCTQLIRSYEQYYKQLPFLDRYTYAACDMAHVEELSGTLSVLAQCLVSRLKSDDRALRKELLTARTTTLSFCLNPAYVDCGVLCANMLEQESVKNDTQLVTAIKAVQNALNCTVLANASGYKSSDATGLSIYFPLKGIDPTYKKSLFAQQTMWLELLQVVQS